jgi:hypothetical protein
VERLGRGIDGMKDYTVKQSLMIVAGGCALLLLCLYLFTPLFGVAGRTKTDTTRLEEAEMANAISRYATVFQHFPADNNAALTKNLTGDNPQQLLFLKLVATSTNNDGQLVDIWSMPYKFVFNSTNSFTITSAGENRAFGDTDDVVFDSRTNSVGTP